MGETKSSRRGVSWRTTYRLAELPIFVDGEGRPLPGRPEREPGPNASMAERIDFMRAVDAYRDAAYDRIGLAFSRHFRKAVG